MNLRAVEIDGEPWFVAKDVCDAMGYTNASKAIGDHVDADDKHNVSLGLPGRAPTLVNESGLYALILSSHKPEAKAFRKWVTSEVLPSIRKHGMYMTQEVAREARPCNSWFTRGAIVGHEASFCAAAPASFMWPHRAQGQPFDGHSGSSCDNS